MIDKNMLAQVRIDLNAALAIVGKKHNIDMTIGNISYSANTFSTKISAVSKDVVQTETPGGVTIDNIKWKKNFLDYAQTYGLRPYDIGRTFTSKGIQYAIVGARPKARLPLVGKPLNGGKCLAVSIATVKATLV